MKGLSFNSAELVELDEYIEWDEWDWLDPDELLNLDAEQMRLTGWMLDEHEQQRSVTNEEIEIWVATSSKKIELKTIDDGEIVSTGDRVKIGYQPTKTTCSIQEVSGFDFLISSDHFPKPVFSQRCANALDSLGDGFLKYTEVYPQ